MGDQPQEKNDVVAAILSLKADLDQRHLENIGAQAVTDAKVVEAIRGIDELRKAFPDGDTAGHRSYHESLIKKNQASTEFYEKLKLELASKGLWALIGLLCVALGSYIKVKFTP